jgi:hypothetical protein
MGPDPGKAGLNPHMIEITLFSPSGKVQFSTQMVVTGSESFPQGVADTHELIVNSNFWEYKRIKPFLDKMDAGFDHGIIRVGKGVFSPPVEVKFGDAGIKGKLKTIVDSVRTPNRRAIAQ